MSGWRDITLKGDHSRRRVKIEPDGSHTFHTTQRVKETFDANRERCAEEVAASTSLWKGRSQVLVGRIPLALVDQWILEEGIDFYRHPNEPEFQRRLAQYLNSNEYEKLRTAPGKI